MLAPLRAVASKPFRNARAYHDLARVTLIGRLGADPILRETSSGKPYYTYSVATTVGPRTTDEAGNRVEPPTSWHTIFAFSEASHKLLPFVTKGSTVYVEAELEMRSGGNASDGTPLPDRPLLRHQKMNVINRVKPADEEGELEDLEQ
ncbi:nucleic acid-binding protein [Cutaneotrichosporon oleaginosum]|uniref:Nucleic acid-binding protein n=1 Tax=Cutaneotrichosporon oleaginosum TaxID=879819 RepID=A0A0J0XX76_9TREE|nr:nucleic acid-binding protein [Cutaneotrichosporon oleaginosum]KLT45643.1 nucleic acid-binding protein [Cutaneotrichosporon oleaginosum]TXT04564.1 hypothetical protein COLE_07383 [Cutaneotrichosporon oleaginosum]